MDQPSDSQQRLIDAAAEIFARQGYYGAGVDRIAERAGVNKRMIYHYFGDKAGLLRAVVAERLSSWNGDTLSEEAALLLLAEAEYLRNGGEVVAASTRRAALAERWSGVHAGVVMATLGSRLLPLLLPHLKQLLEIGELPEDLPEQVRAALLRSAEKRRVTLKADTLGGR